MKCTICGYENPDDAKVCLACSTLLEEKNDEAAPAEAPVDAQAAPAESKPAKKFDLSNINIEETINKATSFLTKNFRNLVTVLAILVGVALVITIGKAIFSGTGYSDTKATIVPMLDKEGTLTFVYNNKPVKGEIDANDYDYSSNLDGSVLLVKTTVQKENSSKATLSVVTKKGIVTIDDADYFKGYAISQDGKYVAFVDNKGTLYLAKASNGDKKEIADNVSGSVCLSPNGKKVAFVEAKENKDGEVKKTMYVYNGKENVDLGNDLTPIALNNSGKYIYYFKTDKDNGSKNLYVTNLKGKSQKLSSNASTSVVLNEDANEVIFFSDGKTYISKNGKDKVKIGSSAFPLCPRGTATYMNGYAMVIAADTFAEKVFRDTDDVVRLNKKFEPTKLVGGTNYDAVISKNLKTVYYTKKDKLYFINATKKDPKPYVVSDDVDSFVMLENGKAAYFMDNDGETVFYAKGKSKPKKIDDDIYSFKLSNDGRLFFIKDMEDNGGTLYVVKGAGKAKKVADDVGEIITTPHVTVFTSDYSEKGETVNVIKSGVKYEAVGQDIVDYN